MTKAAPNTKAKTKTNNKSINFETSLDQLEQLVETMENGDLTLEDSLKAFEQGIKLTRDCQSALTLAEQKVQMLVTENGKLKTMAISDQEQDSNA